MIAMSPEARLSPLPGEARGVLASVAMPRFRSGVLAGIAVLALCLGAAAQTKGRGLKRPPPSTAPKASTAPAASSEPAKDAKEKEKEATPKETSSGEGAPSSDSVTSGDDLGAPPPKTVTDQ